MQYLGFVAGLGLVAAGLMGFVAGEDPVSGRAHEIVQLELPVARTASLAAISPKLVDSIDERSGRPAEGAPNIKEDLRGSVRPPADGKDSQVEQRRWSTLKLERGDTLSGILTARLGLSRPAMLSVANGLEQFMDPRWLQPGQRIAYLLTPAAEGDARLRVLSIQRGIDSKIIISRTGEEEFRARVESIPHEREIVGARFRIGASLYGSAAAAGVPEAVLLSAYRQLSHRLDFQRDLRQGDRVTIAFERFSHGESGPVHPGAMVATTIEQQHRRFAVYRFTSSDGESAYYNQQGVSMETALSRTPVRGGRLSSLFGRRDHPVLGYTRMHKGMDFAAPLGAAVVAAGDGTIVRMSRYGSFGKYVRIRHHSGLSTAYAHLSRYAKNLSKGAKVKQGEVIGYVGATGLATGPNLHYEVLRDGQQVDPRELDLPPRRILEGKSLAEFQEQVRRLSTGLENSPRATIATLTP